MARPSRSFCLTCMGVAALCSYTYLSLALWPDKIFWDMDGEHDVCYIRQTVDYSSGALDLSVISPLSGMGGVVEPLGVWIHPALLPFAYHFSWIDPRIASYCIAIFTAAFSTYCLGRALGLSRLGALIGAQVIAVVFFPPVLTFHFEQLSLAHVWAMSGHLAVPTSLATLFVVVLLQVGRGKAVRSAAAVLLLPSLVLYAVLCDPLWATVAFLPVAILTLGVLAGSSNRRVLWTRLAGLVFCAAILLLSGLHNYYRAVIGYSARVVFREELYVAQHGLDYGTAFFFQNWLTATLVCLLVLSCIAVLRWGTRQQRAFSASVLVIVGTVVALSVADVNIPRLTQFPGAAYIENGALPAYIVAFLAGIGLAWQKLSGVAWLRGWHRWSDPQGRWARTALGCAAVLVVPFWGFATVFQWHVPRIRAIRQAVSQSMTVDTQSGLPGDAGSIVRLLARELAVAPGSDFRGCVVRYVGLPGGTLARFLGLTGVDQLDDTDYERTSALLDTAFPNLHLAGLWRERIPTLDDCSHMIMPPMYFLISRALAGPRDPQLSRMLRVTRIRPNLLAALGTRFVISDQPLNDARLSLRCVETRTLDYWTAWRFLADVELKDPRLLGRLIESNAVTLKLWLYEIERPNLGNYSPVRVRMVSTADEALRAMISKQFDFTREAVAFQRLDNVHLVPAHLGRISFEQGDVRVLARSGGTSLLVLPLQFSNSLHVIGGTSTGAAQPKLMRVNLVQTGILFRGNIDVKIADRFGVFGDVEGRMQDIADCRRLKIVSADASKQRSSF